MPLKKLPRLSKSWSLSLKAKIFFRRLRIILPIILAILIIVGLIFFLRSDFWTIRKISCFNQESVCPANVYGDLSSMSIGKHLIFVSTKRIKTTIIEHYPFIREIKVIKKIPPELRFNLFVREPLAAIETSGEYSLVDEEGYILRKDKTTDLPLILAQDLPTEPIGQRVGQKVILKALEIITNLKLNLIEPEVVLVNEFNIEFKLKDKVKVIFSVFESADSQINPLQFILSRAKIEGRKIRQIDLRFNKPVVIYD